MIKKRTLIILFFVFLALLLSACSGAGRQASSWPDFTVDPNGEVAYLSFGNFVYAVDLKNGTEIWRFPSEKDNKVTFYAAPVLTNDGQLIVGGYDNVLYSLNPENGQQNWTFEGAENRYIASPLVTDEFIYAPSADFSLYALDLSGKLIWTFTTQEALWGTPVTDGEKVYLPSMDHEVYALDAKTGKLVMQTEPEFGGSVAGEPSLSPDGVLYVGTYANQVVALDTDNFNPPLWKQPSSESTSWGWVWDGPTFEDGTLYASELNGSVHALKAEDGTLIWSYPAGCVPNPDQLEIGSIVSKPLVVGDRVYFGSENGNIFAIDKETCQNIWPAAGIHIDDKAKVLAPLQAVNNDIILVAPMGIDGLLIAYNQDGLQQWQFVPAD